MELQEAKDYIESPIVQKYLSQVDDDAEAALDAMKTNVRGMTAYPPAYLKEYKDDAKALEDAWGEFNLEVNKITLGRAKDGKKALAAYKKYVITLGVLEEQNARYGAFVEAGIAALAAALIAFLIDVAKKAEKRVKELEKELPELLKLLKQAKKELKEAEAQRMINVGITVVSLLIPGVGIVGRIAIAAGTFTVQGILDASLGPGKPSALGLTNNFVGDVASVPKSVRPPIAKFAGVATGILTFKMDSDEVDEAQRIVRQLQIRVTTVQKALRELDRFLMKDPGQIIIMHKALDSAVAAARSKAAAFKAAESERMKLMRELAKIK